MGEELIGLGICAELVSALRGLRLQRVSFSSMNISLTFGATAASSCSVFSIGSAAHLVKAGGTIEQSSPLFKDALCALLGDWVVELDGTSASEFSIKFSTGVTFSFHREFEAAMFTDDKGLMICFDD